MCNTEEQRKRVLLELNLFKDSWHVNCATIFKNTADVCKEHNIVLGVGRGSSIPFVIAYPLGVQLLIV